MRQKNRSKRTGRLIISLSLLSLLFALVCVPASAAGSSTINWPSMPNHGNVTMAANSTSGGGSFGSSASYDSADNWYKFSKSTVPMYVMDFTLKNTGNNVLSDMNPSYTYHVKQEFIVYCNTPGVNFYQLISSFSKPVFSCTVLGGGKSSSVEVTSFTGTYAVYVTFEFDVTEFTKVETLRYRIDGGGQSVPAYEFWLRVSDTEVTVKSPNDDIIDMPVAPPPNQGGVDGTLSDYQNKEEQLNSNISPDNVASAIGGLNLSGIIKSANVFGDCFSYLWGKLGKMQVVSQFAVVSGVVMMLLGLGVTVGNVMEIRRSDRIRAQERAARQASADAERAARFGNGENKSFDIGAVKHLGYDLPDPDDHD